ncbi:MAG: peptidoglycan editing factor PgeF [Thermomonas sp.]|uniref:peptidoglycan editing factor PgeF n=1 Tax=Thermomonas sp. TaxID=1971895 RepID=UPI002635AD9E|nr:peptidoglycan editing factor PgeF [Thermomonas sp.]MCC7096863.1 peptidoglycan editing factor PgeF [Thermomonas sp.]
MSAFLQADWPAPPGVCALVSQRDGLGVSSAPFDTFNLGTRCGDAVDAVAENRRQLGAALALPSRPRWLRQVHGIGVAVEPGVDEPEADASVTRTPGTVLAVLTADCLPVVIAARSGGTIAVAHAGWRGLCAGVLEATVAAMQVPSDGLVAWLGPAAGPRAYEVGKDVFDAFVSRDARARLAFQPTRPDHWNANLYTLARQRLLDVGVQFVHGGVACTISETDRYFSHRRDGRSGRMATLAWMTR